MTIQKTLICITTCNRLTEVKKYIFPYVNFCNKNEQFDFLLALDGKESDYLKFCQLFQIPLLYSEQREGVGLSKNRVLKQFPDYDYYFFIDDDVELLNDRIFELFIETSKATGYSHFSYSHTRNILRIEYINGITLVHNTFGGGQFNFYTRNGIQKVGGWHTCFAKYRRYGHTEHTYRFYFSGLIPSPFIFIDEARSMFITHDPPHVSEVNTAIENPATELIPDEEQLIAQKNSFFPVTTLYPFYYNDYNRKYNPVIASFLKEHTGRYPLIKGRDRRTCFSELYFFYYYFSKSLLKKLGYFLLAFTYDSSNKLIKHEIKRALGLL